MIFLIELAKPPVFLLSFRTTTTTKAMSIDDQLKVLRESLEEHVPYTAGVYAVKPEDLVVYYDLEKDVNFPRATEDDLEKLTAACQQATFGMGGADVLDESYRKAGKMDLNKFAARFDVAGLLETITPDIMQGQNADGDKFLQAEMYKLNVYGPGSFFKAHKDTPRSEDMIGSLVVVFPTTHAGGVLTLEHGANAWAFDSAVELASATNSTSLAYIAFYSDVTHAVEPVHTGYRVTLTYNLFLADRRTATGPQHTRRHLPAPEQALDTALRTLLASPAFLPSGGFLAYGLSHQYSFPAPPKLMWVDFKPKMPPTRLGPVLRLLKGTDARIRTVSERVGLATHLKVLYDSGQNDRYSKTIGNDVLVDDVLNVDHVNESYEMVLKDEIEALGTLLEQGSERKRELQRKRDEERKGMYGNFGDDSDSDEEQASETGGRAAVPVHWVTKITDLNRVGTSYVRYGNEASIGHVYGNAALFVEVPAVGEGVRAHAA
ncbi:hypothetical protein K438DRAFT_2023152 [Mycena galopus ATCC 62051]|nr:hypothetical protein K438DRAFT_2023152 [Mycena galopus ATCC 62051]